ncbi:MAG TPA: PqqD family protein [Polyangia bacterium]|nr:PqqD family protein [Polyangia bacterium]
MSTLRRADGYVSRRVGDEIVIVPVRAGVANLEAIFTMNAVGAEIWGRLDGKTEAAAIAAAVAAEYDVPAGQAADDVRDFLSVLAAKGLVVQGGAER